MSDIENEIEAVKFLLASFFLNPIQAKREQSIAEKYATNNYVAVYADFSKEALQQQLVELQRSKNILESGAGKSTFSLRYLIKNSLIIQSQLCGE